MNGYLKTDTHTDGRTHAQGRILRTPSGKPEFQNYITTKNQQIKLKGKIKDTLHLNMLNILKNN